MQCEVAPVLPTESVLASGAKHAMEPLSERFQRPVDLHIRKSALSRSSGNRLNAQAKAKINQKPLITKRKHVYIF